MLVFSEQDVIRDPPFSKLDLVSCRNLLIYMGGPLQQKLIPLFHYALNLGGLLLLGTSESVGDFRDLFAALDRKAKLYVSKNNEDGEQRHAMRQFIKPVSRGEGSPLSRGGKLSTVARKETRRELTERVMLNHFTPASILVTRSGEILYLHGRTGKYLEMATGDIGVNILRMAREGLRRDLTTALHAAITHKEKVSRPGLRVKTNGDFSTVNLTVYPVAPCIEAEGEKPSAWTHTVSGARAGYESGVDSFQYLVILEDAPEPVPVVAATVNPADLAFGAELNPTDTQVIIATLRQELRSKDEYLQSATEELEVSGEEMQSVNEELQSSNEELETSKEELQSINEELSTVNAELQNKVLSLLQANNDMNNLLAGTGVGTVFVNQQLCIQRFTPAVTGLINLIPTDIGRPIGHTVTNLLDYHCLENDVQAVLDTLLPIEIEVQTKAGAWFLMCIRPYRTLENVPEGVVINFIEISRMVAAQESLRRLAVVVNDAHDAITMVDLMGRILAWNPAAERLYGWSEAEALAMNVRELIPEGLRLEALAKVHQLVQAETLEPYQTHRLTKDGRDITVWVTATALLNKAGEVYAIASTERHHGLEL